MPGTKICGVDDVRERIFDATPDVAVVLLLVVFFNGLAVIAFCTVFKRMYFGGVFTNVLFIGFVGPVMMSFADWPSIGLEADEMPESSENAETLSLHGSLSGVLDKLEWPSLIGDID